MAGKSFSPKYRDHVSKRSPEWLSVCKRTHAMTGNRCAMFWWLRSRDCDHLHYQNLGHEQPWRDTVPLSKTGHWLITQLRILFKLLPWGGQTFRELSNWVLRFACLGAAATSVLFGKAYIQRKSRRRARNGINSYPAKQKRSGEKREKQKPAGQLPKEVTRGPR